MKLGRHLYRHALVAFAIAIFFTNVSDYTERYGAIPLFWIFVFGVVSLPAILSGIARGKITIPPLVWWCAGYLVISMVSFYASSQDENAFQEVQTRFISTIFLMLTLIAFAKPAYQRLAQKWIAGAVLLATALNLYELFNPLTFSTIPGRSSGLYTNVNQSGAALVLGLILSYQVIPDRLKLAYVAITAVGVIPTFSRAAMLGWLIVVGYFFIRAGLAAQLRQLAIISVACIGLLYSPLGRHSAVAAGSRRAEPEHYRAGCLFHRRTQR